MLCLHQLCTRGHAHGLLHAGCALGVEVGSVDLRRTEKKSPSESPRGTHVYPNGDCHTDDWAFNLPQGYREVYTCLEPRPGTGAKKNYPKQSCFLSDSCTTYAGYWNRGECHHVVKHCYSSNERHEGTDARVFGVASATTFTLKLCSQTT